MRPPAGVPDDFGRGDAPGANSPPARLTPEMASFRALVLDFVRGYIARWGQSPSYGEIAAGTRSNRTRVRRALRSLEAAGLLLRRPGARGLSLPCEIDRARLTLIRAGVLLPGEGPVTKATLLPPPALDYPDASTDTKGKPRHGNSERARE